MFIIIKTKTSHSIMPTMDPNLKLFPLSNLHKIEPLKRVMEATTSGRVDQLWTKEKCPSHPWHLLGKLKTAGQGCGLHHSPNLPYFKRVGSPVVALLIWWSPYSTVLLLLPLFTALVFSLYKESGSETAARELQ